MTTENEKSINSLRKIMEEGDELRKFIRPKEAKRIYSISRSFLEDVAKESGAMYKIGKVILINVKTFEDYLEKGLQVHRAVTGDHTLIYGTEDFLHPGT